MALQERNLTDLAAYALSAYRDDGIRKLVLHAQDAYEADVNVILYAAWVGEVGGVQIGLPEIELAVGKTLAWHIEIVRPLRRLRKQLKESPHLTFSDRAAALRDEVKAIELEAEILELDTLNTLDACGAKGRSTTGRLDIRDRNIQAVIAYYKARLSAGDDT